MDVNPVAATTADRMVDGAALGIRKSAAGNRCIRALERLKEILAELPDLAELS
jgi:hypothetical protein